ncbi:hypothetical protein [Aeromicrobium sp. Leaf291]|uniref:hypothetical protein n=1 Tax=Aeromicrobium sp. Leaf291 TaxID=1736325 RepID=UPI000700AE19|nr:hypothetical protein [Aeromicrobium sp. Leaf291]KQP81565.1 hypothetical protein ASF35_16170 [Aeromicrobium sp. Leaf291]
MSNQSSRKLARRVHQIESRVAAGERAAQSAYRSIEAGAMTVYDEDGNPVAALGKAADGTVGLVDLVDATPAAPADVNVTPGSSSIVVQWAGEYLEDQPAGVTIAYIGVHASPEEGEEWDDSTEVAQLPPAGGVLTLPADSDVPTYVTLVAVSAAGTWSAPGDVHEVTPFYYDETLEQLMADFQADLTGAVSAVSEMGTAVAAAAQAASAANAAAVAAQDSANGKNRVWYVTPPTPYVGVVGDTWFDAANGYRLNRWSGTEWVASELGHQAIGSLDLGKATVGWLDVANRVKAGSITSPLLAVTGDNVFPDTGFRTDAFLTSGTGGRFGNGTGWDVYTAGSGARAVRYTVPAGGGTGFFDIFPVTSGTPSNEPAKAAAREQWLQVSGGERWMLRFAHYKTATRFKVYANFLRTDGTTGGVDLVCQEDNAVWVTAAGNSTTMRSYVLTVPENVTHVALRVQVEGAAGQTWAMYGETPTLHRMESGRLLVDGIITAAKLAVGAMTAKLIEGDVIATALAGQRVQISQTGIATYNTANAITATLSAAAGGMNLSGVLNVAETGEVRIGGTTHHVRVRTASPDGYGARGSILFDGSAYSKPAEIFADASDTTRSSIQMNSPATASDTVRTYLRLVSAGAGSSPNEIWTNTSWLNFVGSTTLYAQAALWIAPGGNTRLAPAGDAQLEPEGYVTSNQIYNFTASATANMAINANTRRIHRTSSSLRYKQDVQDLVVDEGLFMRLRPRTWLDKAEVARYADDETGTEPMPLRYPGFVAEEVLEDGGGMFVEFVDGRAESLHYDRMIAAAVLAMRALARENEELKKKNAELDAKVVRLDRKHTALDRRVALIEGAA